MTNYCQIFGKNISAHQCFPSLILFLIIMNFRSKTTVIYYRKKSQLFVIRVENSGKFSLYFLILEKVPTKSLTSIFCWCNLISIDSNVYFYQNRQKVTKKETKVNKFTVFLIWLQMKTHTMNLTQTTKRKGDWMAKIWHSDTFKYLFSHHSWSVDFIEKLYSGEYNVYVYKSSLVQLWLFLFD